MENVAQCPICSLWVLEHALPSHTDQCFNAKINAGGTPPPPVTPQPPVPISESDPFLPPPSYEEHQAVNQPPLQPPAAGSFMPPRQSSASSYIDVDDFLLYRPIASSQPVSSTRRNPIVVFDDSDDEDGHNAGGDEDDDDESNVCPICGTCIVDGGMLLRQHVNRCLDGGAGREMMSRQTSQTGPNQPMVTKCPYCQKEVPTTDFIAHASACVAEAETRLYCTMCKSWQRPADLFSFDCKWSHKFCTHRCALDLVRGAKMAHRLLDCPVCEGEGPIPSSDIALLLGEHDPFVAEYREMEFKKVIESLAHCPRPGCEGRVDLPETDAESVWMHAACPVCEERFCYVRKFKKDRVLTIQNSVMDLYVNLARAASRSGRWELVFEPFPTISAGGMQLVAYPIPDGTEAPKKKKKKNDDHDSSANQKRDIELAKTVLNSIPPMEDLVSRDSSFAFDVRKAIERVHPLAYSMYLWLLDSYSRCSLTCIPRDRQVNCMGTPYQYLLITGPPESEMQFQALKARHGTKFAFHGSNAENWHSILHNGLRNASGTKLQVNGAAHGKGIYLSPKAQVSFGYSRMGVKPSAPSLTTDFLDVSTMHCIAVVEVVDHQIKKSGDIWVQPNEACVQTRFLFVYQHGAISGSDTDLGKAEISAEFKRAMDCLRQEAQQGIPAAAEERKRGGCAQS